MDCIKYDFQAFLSNSRKNKGWKEWKKGITDHAFSTTKEGLTSHPGQPSKQPKTNMDQDG